MSKPLLIPALLVLKGRQTIIANNQADLLTYGDPPLDLNITATSGLPVSLQVLDGNESVDLNGTRLYDKAPRFCAFAGFSGWG